MLELVEVGLEHFEQHVIKIILAELLHLQPCAEGPREQVLDVAFLGTLVHAPGLVQARFHVLLVQQVAEDELVLINGFF